MKYTIEMHRRMQFIKQQIAECQNFRQWEDILPKDVAGQICETGQYASRAKHGLAEKMSQVEDRLRKETGKQGCLGWTCLLFKRTTQQHSPCAK